MEKKFSPLIPRLPRLLHGADYNPDQWLHMPQILEDDYRQMKEARCNVMTLAVFSWSILEPEENEFNFEWLDRSMDQLYSHGVYTILATPSGARPPWLARKYPEVLRVDATRRRALYGGRHNHCYTSKAFRERSAVLIEKMAERYSGHPGLVLWHLSNELGGECHCPLCQDAFRQWLKGKYKGSLTALNQAWYTSFWSQLYSEWEEIESPSPLGQSLVHGLNLDWKRFVTYQTIDYVKSEIRILKRLTPGIPVTTNLMGTDPGLNYWELAGELDLVSWDSYPFWHTAGTPDESEARIACETGFKHDLTRSLKKGQPFLLMESTPSQINWGPVCKIKKPGMHLLSSMQAVAHGSDSVQYFQWRQARGNCEKFHGAVIDHSNSTRSRAFRGVAEVGRMLEKLAPVLGTGCPAEVAVIFDWENRWGIEDAQGPLNDERKEYVETCIRHYTPFWERGITVDILDMKCDLGGYKLVIGPMLYMLRDGFPDKVKALLEDGGTFVTTYLSGICDEQDLCFLNGFPGPLSEVLGIRVEETEPLLPAERKFMTMRQGNPLRITGTYSLRDYCALLQTDTARTLAAYTGDYYAGTPALTVNKYGKGEAYYIGSRNESGFLSDFYNTLARELGITPNLECEPPPGVSVQKRTDGRRVFIFVLNFNNRECGIELGSGVYLDLDDGSRVSGRLALPAYGVRILSGEKA